MGSVQVHISASMPRAKKRRWVSVLTGLMAFAMVYPAPARAESQAQPAATTAPKLMDYKVQAGDNCSNLAKHLYGDAHRVDLIHQNNDLGPQPHKLRPGQILHVPVRATAGPQEPDARLTFVRNQVEAYTPEYHRGQKNEALAQGNRVGTLASSSAEISFADETQMQLGEHSMVVIFGDTPPGAGRHRRAAGAEEATLLKGTLRAQLAELSGPATGAQRPPLVVATPSGSVEMPRQSGEVHLDVDPQKTTRLSVLRGRSKLAAAGQKVDVPAGFGSRADQGRPPTPPRPLPLPPVFAPTLPPLLLGKGTAVPVILTYHAEPGNGPPAAFWHRQLARDASFNDLVIDTKVAADVLTWPLGDLPTGELYARVSAIDADRFEGRASAVAHTQVALLQIVPATKAAPATLVFPHGLLCGLDGAPLGATAQVALRPAHDHQVRCARTPDKAGEVTELTIAAADSGTVLAPIQLGPAKWTATDGERDLSFQLTDSTGAPLPIPVADVQVSAAPNVSVSPVVASAAGEYRTHVRWPTTVVDLRLAVQLRGVQLAAIPLTADLKDSEPPPDRSLPLAPPRLVPVPPPLGAPRVYFDLAAFGSALFNQDVYGFGGGIELGPRIRLPFGSLRIALRVLAEDAVAPGSSPVMLNVGGVVTYVLGGASWPVSPYLGIWPQGVLQRTSAMPELLGVRNNTGFILGGLAGLQVRLAHGGLFAELGYRGRLAEQLPAQAPEWNAGFALLGYRLSL